jgi:tRNA threonylcarbamoyladenosine biosynthesis protein TsaB
MSWLLHIDTAVQLGSICLSKDEQAIGIKINATQNDHASWLQPAIQKLLQEHDVVIRELAAICVSAGPGSYTGLRVSMATAKGLCYALQKPLITISTLKMMAAAASNLSADFFCPMIDARRIEVFTAIYDKNLNELVKPHNVILTEADFSEFFEKGKLVFFGNGSEKLKPLLSHPNVLFEKIETTSEQMVALAYEKYVKNDFADLAYTEPFYGKEFYSPALKNIK